MTIEALSATPVANRSIASSLRGANLAAAASKLASGLRVGGSSLLKRLQISRMRSILMRMSDDQLAQIGIKRAEIASYAVYLLSSGDDE